MTGTALNNSFISPLKPSLTRTCRFNCYICGFFFHQMIFVVRTLLSLRHFRIAPLFIHADFFSFLNDNADESAAAAVATAAAEYDESEF